MTLDDDKFFAWLDGELSGAEAAEVAAAVASNPKLTRRAEQHRSLSRTLRSAFEQVSAAPVPDRIAAAVARPHAEVIDFAKAAGPRGHRRSGGLAPWMGIAASLALGLLLGALLRLPGTAQFRSDGSGLYAAASLEQALDAQLASAPATDDVRIGLTFRDRAGDICRSFTARGSAGLACRYGNRWNVRGLFDAPEAQPGDYRMASGTDPNLASLIDSSIAGEPLDERQEKAAQQNGWR